MFLLSDLVMIFGKVWLICGKGNFGIMPRLLSKSVEKLAFRKMWIKNEMVWRLNLLHACTILPAILLSLQQLNSSLFTIFFLNYSKNPFLSPPWNKLCSTFNCSTYSILVAQAVVFGWRQHSITMGIICIKFGVVVLTYFYARCLNPMFLIREHGNRGLIKKTCWEVKVQLLWNTHLLNEKSYSWNLFVEVWNQTDSLCWERLIKIFFVCL